MEQHRLYLFDGHTFILVPESAWLTELKSNPVGVTAIKSLEDPLILKGWIKLLAVQNPNDHSYTSEWFFEETGTHMRVLVDGNGQLTVDGAPVGSTTMGETMKVLQKIAEEKAGKWVTTTREVLDEHGGKVLARRRVFIPQEKIRKPKEFEGGAGTKKPEDITRINEKGGPHPTADVLGTFKQETETHKQDAMSQLIGTYSPLTLAEEEKPTRAEAVRLLSESGKMRTKDPEKAKELARRAFKMFHQLREMKKAEPEEEVLRTCNRMLELAEKEENEEEKRRLCEEVERQLATLEAACKSDKPLGDGDWPTAKEGNPVNLKSQVKGLIREEAAATKEYRQMARQAENPTVKRALESISRDEAEHNKKLKEINRKLG